MVYNWVAALLLKIKSVHIAPIALSSSRCYRSLLKNPIKTLFLFVVVRFCSLLIYIVLDLVPLKAFYVFSQLLAEDFGGVHASLCVHFIPILFLLCTFFFYCEHLSVCLRSYSIEIACYILYLLYVLLFYFCFSRIFYIYFYLEYFIKLMLLLFYQSHLLFYLTLRFTFFTLPVVFVVAFVYFWCLTAIIHRNVSSQSR